jgi:Uncharacterized protein conserved in bacteria (DUF2252)
MKFPQATREYETWLAGHVRIIRADLTAKHELMAGDPFSFLRATFYRWMQLFPQLCPKLADTPRVLAVGDLHVENYGTWRDAEGRLIWGINDFDEAYPLPYALDLVRLAASARLAIRVDHLTFQHEAACSAILDGYTAGLEHEGQPFVLAEKHPLLREALTSHLRDPCAFWDRLTSLPDVRPVPAQVRRLLRESLPEPPLPFRVAKRRAGLGSLGRERYTAIADWRGGKIAREAKALLPSACTWAADASDRKIYYSRILKRAVRTPDPFLTLRDGWVVRRLSPYCGRVELAQMPRNHDVEKLLRAMGRELANIHLGSPQALQAVRRDLSSRKPEWLSAAAAIMADATLADWREWQKAGS